MSDPTARRQRLLDRVFLVGIAVKGLDGVLELLVGIPLLFLHPDQLDSLAHRLTTQELREDPHDLIAHLLLTGTAALTADAALLTAAYLVIHGLVKVAIIVAMIRGSARVYPWAIAALTAFLLWQLIELIVQPSLGVAALTVVDAVIIALTWREWRENRSLHDVVRKVFPRRLRAFIRL